MGWRTDTGRKSSSWRTRPNLSVHVMRTWQFLTEIVRLMKFHFLFNQVPRRCWFVSFLYQFKTLVMFELIPFCLVYSYDLLLSPSILWKFWKLIGNQGLGLLRLHSTYRHDLKIYASDEGRVQMTAAAFAKGLLALEGELTPILFQVTSSFLKVLNLYIICCQF